MENVARKIASKLLDKALIAEDDVEFFRYCIESIIIYSINLITMFTIAAIIGKAAECAILLGAVMLLRPNSGGFHMSTWYGCYIVSTAIVILIIYAADKFIITWPLFVLIIAVSAAGIFLWAPIENDKNPLPEDVALKCKKKARLYSIAIAAAGVALKACGLETAAFLFAAAEAMCFLLLVISKLHDLLRKC